MILFQSTCVKNYKMQQIAKKKNLLYMEQVILMGNIENQKNIITQYLIG